MQRLHLVGYLRRHTGGVIALSIGRIMVANNAAAEAYPSPLVEVERVLVAVAAVES